MVNRFANIYLTGRHPHGNIGNEQESKNNILSPVRLHENKGIVVSARTSSLDLGYLGKKSLGFGLGLRFEWGLGLGSGYLGSKVLSENMFSLGIHSRSRIAPSSDNKAIIRSRSDKYNVPILAFLFEAKIGTKFIPTPICEIRSYG